MEVTMVICCYIENNKNKWDKFNNIDDFRTKHPGMTPSFVFNITDDINTRELIQKQEFEKYAYRFGFEPDDYNKHLLLPEGEECIFTGFLPKKRKYVCQAYSLTRKVYYSMTKDYTKNAMQRYQQKQKVNFVANAQNSHGGDS